MGRNEAAAVLLGVIYLYLYIKTMNGIRKELQEINKQLNS